jgi:hypothetical protein
MKTNNRRNFVTSALLGLAFLALGGSALHGQELVPPPVVAAGPHAKVTRLNIQTMSPRYAVRGQEVTVTARLTIPGKPWQGLEGAPVWSFLKVRNSLDALDALPPQRAWSDNNGMVTFIWQVPKDLPRNINKLYIPVHFYADWEFRWSGDFAILQIRP